MAKIVKTRVEFEGRWHEEEVIVEEEELEVWKPDADLSIVGRETPRVDGPARVSGRAVYTYDVHLPGMLYAGILRSPHPHAKIQRLDPSNAEALDGVRGVLSHRNAPSIPWYNDSFLFDQTLRYQGEEVAAVAAVSEEIAGDALDLIEVEYEELPFVVDLEEAIQPDSPKIRPGGNILEEGRVYQRGDLEQGLAQAEVVVEGTYRTPTALHNCLEPHGTVAKWDGDHLTLWESTQHIFGVRQQAATALGLPLNKVRVIKEYMGGGFGSKGSAHKQTVIAALLARQTGRPVKLMLTREEENLATGNRHPSIQHIRVGAKKDGTLTALYLKTYVGIGAYGMGGSLVSGPMRELYACENVRTEEYAVYTNTGPSCAFRAPGFVEGTFAFESVMDDLAAELSMDPMELRLKNYTDRNQVVDRPYSSKGLREAYRIGAEKIGWDRRREPKAEGPKRRGIGMASQIWGAGGGPPSYALIRINPDGGVDLLAGTQDIGTGTRTILAQIAAEELGVRVEDINVVIGDTQDCPYCVISAGSMTVPSVGPAVRSAAWRAKEQLLDIASSMLEVPMDQLNVKNGEIFSVSSPEKRIGVREVATRIGNYMIIGKGARGPNPEKVNLNTFGAQFAEVEVDVETGQIVVLNVVAVHEVGRVINPLTAGSQVEGGVIQSMGFGLTEGRIMDRPTGNVANPNLLDYKVPTVLDLPEIETAFVPLTDPVSNSLGCKGLGEPPIIPTAAAVANAIYDAIGVRFSEAPITPDKVLNALGSTQAGNRPR